MTFHCDMKKIPQKENPLDFFKKTNFRPKYCEIVNSDL